MWEALEQTGWVKTFGSTGYNAANQLATDAQGNSYIAGETFSAADITALVTVDFAARAFDMPLPRNALALKRWYDTASARPSMAA